MADFALVTFENGKKNVKPDRSSIKRFVDRLLKYLNELLFNAGIFKSRLGTKLYYSVKRKHFDDGIKKTALYDNLNMWILRLPFKASRLAQLNHDSINSYLAGVCSDRNICSCLMPACIHERSSFSACTGQLAARNTIFKALLIPVLDEIYIRSGLRIDTLDTVVVCGDNDEFLTVVRLLEPYIKYVTVAAEDRELADSKLSEISADSGLSISVSSDYKSILRHADLVINMGNPAVISKCRLQPKSLVINYYGGSDGRIQGENPVINGIEYELPKAVSAKLGEDTAGCFTRKELAEIVFIHRLEMVSDFSFDYLAAVRISDEFRKDGYGITGFTGRRGVLRIENVLKALRV